MGFLIRIISQFFIFKWKFAAPFSDFAPIVANSALAETLIPILFVISISLLTVLFGKLIDHIVTQYNKMGVVIVNKSTITREDLEEVFPKNQDYFDLNWKTENSS